MVWKGEKLVTTSESRDILDNPLKLEKEQFDTFNLYNTTFINLSFLFSLNDKHKDDFGILINGDRYSAVFVADGVSDPGVGGRGSLASRFVCKSVKEIVNGLESLDIDIDKNSFQEFLDKKLKHLKEYITKKGIKHTATTLTGVILDKKKGTVFVFNIGDSDVRIFPFYMGPKNDFYILDEIKPTYRQALYTSLVGAITERGIKGVFTTTEYKLFP